MGILSREQIIEMGFAGVGDNARLSDKASYYNCSKISIGNNVRIDDFCVLSAGDGGIEIGNYVHIAVNVSLIGKGKIALHDFSAISARTTVYSSNDDYSGEALSNPTIHTDYTNVTHADVTIGRHAIIGTGCVILPGASLDEGVAIGALSLVNKKCEAFGIYFGTPAIRIRERSRNLLELEKAFLAQADSQLNR